MSKVKICLDAGHYGKYNRSPVVKSYYESDMAWKLHLLLKKYLEEYGIEVTQTRTNQATDLELTTRGKKAKDCDLFISIHSNAVGSGANETVDYPVVYVPLNGKADVIGKKIADCVESTMGTKQKGRTATRKGNNGDYYGVIRGAVSVGVPGIIIEHSFHTHTRATQWLMDDNNLDKMAKAEADVIAAHYGIKRPAAQPEHLYRVRKSWSDASSQRGAYKELENAKKNCPTGYSVYDWNGVAVWSPFQCYKVKILASVLNVRAGAGTTYKVNTTVKKGGVYTIVAENGGWGKLKSGAGWISLNSKYCTKL